MSSTDVLLPPPLRQSVPKEAEDNKINEEVPVAIFHPNEALWSSSVPELQRACFFARVALDRPPVVCKFKKFPGILQEGPTCGLVALSMLFDKKISAKELLEQAISEKYTNNGEMFSAANLLQLLRLNLHYLNNKIETFLYTGELNSDKIISELKSDAILLVPYDADVTHAPAKLKGHKAHWALVIGYLVTENQEVFVIARHGKSRNMAVWSLERLSESNAGLLEFAQPKQHENQVFLLPEGGISGDNGLCQKCIVIKGVDNKEIVL